MKITSKTILFSKRNFTTKLNENKADSSIREYNAREEFEIIEYLKCDDKYKYAIITPLSDQNNKHMLKHKLLYNLNSLSSHFYFRRA